MQEMGKIGHMLPDGMSSAIFWISWNKIKLYIFSGRLLDFDWELVQKFMLQEFFEFWNCFIVLILGSQVNFGKNDEEGNLQEETKANVLFGHFLHTHVCTDNDNSEIWRETGQAVDCCLKVLFVATEISDWDDFAA